MSYKLVVACSIVLQCRCRFVPSKLAAVHLVAASVPISNFFGSFMTSKKSIEELRQYALNIVLPVLRPVTGVAYWLWPAHNVYLFSVGTGVLFFFFGRRAHVSRMPAKIALRNTVCCARLACCRSYVGGDVFLARPSLEMWPFPDLFAYVPFFPWFFSPFLLDIASCVGRVGFFLSWVAIDHVALCWRNNRLC